MRINPVMDKFYQGMLEYAGLELKDDVIVNKTESLGKYTVDDCEIALPYMDLLKNPNGKAFFHPLNENYVSPENTLFIMYKNRLTLELNLRLTTLVTSILTVAADIQIQKRVRSSKLMEVISSIGEPDHSVIEAFLGMVKASTKQNKEGFLVDLYLKKNGEIEGTPYAAIGKVNFRMMEEIERSLNAPEKDYKVFGSKFRKKDLLIISDVFGVIFGDITGIKYTVGTDNKVFRYLNVLLKTAYLVSETVNDVATLLGELEEPLLRVEDMVSPNSWIQPLEELQGMAAEIRLIPGQVNIATEAKRLKLDESKAATQQAPAPQPVTQAFNPNMVQQSPPPQQPAAYQQPQQPQQPQQQPQQAPTAEDIIRGNVQQPMQQPMYNPMMQQPMYNNMMPQQQLYTPSWVQAEAAQQQQMNPNMGLSPQQQQMLLQQQLLQQQQQQQMNPNMGLSPQQQMMMQQQLLQQQQFQQPMYNNMMPQQQPQGQLALNPAFLNQVQAPWNH